MATHLSIRNILLNHTLVIYNLITSLRCSSLS